MGAGARGVIDGPVGEVVDVDSDDLVSVDAAAGFVGLSQPCPVANVPGGFC